MKLPTYKVPFTSDAHWKGSGHLLPYTGYDELTADPLIEWRDNKQFRAILFFQNFQRGRSAAHALWADQSGHQYQMFLADLGDLISGSEMSNGRTYELDWYVRKRGMNYGIARYID